jgi:pimeloyl-ACP methyl ester carboxylesterase
VAWSKPGIVHGREAIARAEDDVDVDVSADGLAQPVRERELWVEARHLERVGAVGWPKVDVEVPRVVRDTGIQFERVPTADQECHRRLAQRVQCPEVDRPRVWIRAVLDLPARIVWGAADQFQKVGYAERLARDLRAPLDRIAGGRHFVPEDHAERVAAAINALIPEAAS